MPEARRFLRGVMPWPFKVLVAVGFMLALASYGLHRWEQSRDADPPANLGAVARGGFLACPQLQGNYTWARRRAGDGESYRGGGRGWKGPIPFYLYEPETQVWIRWAGKELELRSRLVVRAENVRHPLAEKWSTARYKSWDYSCRSGVLEVDETELETGEDFGGTAMRRGFKLVRLSDGALAVGVRTTATGRTAPLFSWGDASAGTIPVPPRTTWRWIRLTHEGPGDTEPVPVKGPRAHKAGETK